MSDIFNNFDSTGAGDDSRDITMASPSQNSPMTNSNANSGIIPGGMTNLSNIQNNGIPMGASAGSANISKPSGFSESQPLMSKPRLMELVREVDSTAQLDEDVEEFLLQMTDDFVDNLIRMTCNYAKHRKSSKVEVRDVQLHLERKWNMWIPGFGTDELRPYKRAAVTEAHKQRLALIRKTIKKY